MDSELRKELTAMRWDKLKDGKKKGDTIIGRFEKIKQLEARTQKSIPEEFITDADFVEASRQ